MVMTLLNGCKGRGLPLVACSLLLVITSAVQAQVLRPESLEALGPPPIPADNPMSDAKVELGKLLFFDPKLSGNGAMSCSVCHMPAAAWAILAPISFGYPGTTYWRNIQTIINSAYYNKTVLGGCLQVA
jgi:cytochrome c peroxidase